MLKKIILHKLGLFTTKEVSEIAKTNRESYNKMIEYWKNRAEKAEKELYKDTAYAIRK